MTVLKAVLLIIGGLALGFFGCLGGLAADNSSSGVIIGVSLGVGGIIALWGTIQFFLALGRRFTKVVNPNEPPTGPPPPESGVSG